MKLTLGLIVSALTVGALMAAALDFLLAGAPRQTLWRAVQACIVDYRLTGAAFPCLQVNLAGGQERGYVLIRAPFGRREVVLAPTRKVVGVEDPWLQLPDAPNYFEDAWRARSLLERPDQKPAAGDFALAVNPAVMRRQDQLHIHLGCLFPDEKRAVESFAARLQIGEWSRVPTIIYDAEFWGLRLGRAGLAGANPFRLAAEGPAGKDGGRSGLMIVVAAPRLAGEDQWLILATNLVGSGTYTDIAAEDILDPSCEQRSATQGRRL
ncbi:MAG: CDP-diacylglycerol diphosphatase [Hyphomicrobiales bacterium]|nr:CDP-diacylglycerol diphosphatase [Hyphomicrobiales bacterium]